MAFCLCKQEFGAPLGIVEAGLTGQWEEEVGQSDGFVVVVFFFLAVSKSEW